MKRVLFALIGLASIVSTACQDVVSACDLGTFLVQANNLVACNPLQAACPENYECARYSVADAHFCCTRNVSQSLVCPSGSAVWRVRLTGRPMQCIPNSGLASCPRGHGCLFSAAMRGHFCCSNAAVGFCPAGTTPYIDPLTQQPPTCDPTDSMTCPSHYTCQFSVLGNAYHCCPFIDDPMCPFGVLDRGFCIPHRPHECPRGYDCIYSHANFRFVCCARDVPPIR